MQEFQFQVQVVNELLDATSVAPDPNRRDWDGQRLQDVRDQYADLVTHATRSTAELSASDAADAWASVVRIAGEVVALLHAAGRFQQARELLAAAIERAPDGDAREELRAAKRDLEGFGKLNYGRWLMRQKRVREATIALKAARETAREEVLRRNAQRVLDAPRPLTRAPQLASFYGIGLGMSGARDRVRQQSRGPTPGAWPMLWRYGQAGTAR